MKKINFFTSCITVLLAGFICYIFWNEYQEEHLIQANINRDLRNLPQDTSAQSDSCLWLWYASTTLYKVCADQNGNTNIGYGSRNWRQKFKATPSKMYFSDGDFNLNDFPEIYLFGLTPYGYVVQAYEFQHETLKSFVLPPLMGTHQIEYRGCDTLYFEKNFLVRQFSTNSGQKACYYELMPNLQFELRFTKTL